MALRDLPAFTDLRSFLAFLERDDDLRRIAAPVDLVHEMTEIHRRVLVAGGPVLRFDNARTGATAAGMPVIANLFGTRGSGWNNLDGLCRAVTKPATGTPALC